jgi:hypothetical protein
MADEEERRQREGDGDEPDDDDDIDDVLDEHGDGEGDDALSGESWILSDDEASVASSLTASSLSSNGNDNGDGEDLDDDWTDVSDQST